MQPNPQRLFFASCVALVATAMTFAIRANLIDDLGKEFSISPAGMGWVISTAFWGFTLSMMVGGVLCDILGMKRLLVFAFAGHVAGIILTIFATGFWSLFVSTLFVGIANGFVEAACNPLVASLYPEEKTKKLNQFHVWFPGGNVIGGLAAYGMDRLKLGWEIQVGIILVPTIIYGILFFPQRFPVTERVSSGVSMSQMFRECLRPLFFFMVVCMLMTSTTELGTSQWLIELLQNVGVPASLLMVFINALMAGGRSMAGVVEEKLSSTGILLSSAILSCAGLLLLSSAEGYAAFGAAALFALGICFFWPTMLGFVSENLPKTGALGLSVMGGAGMLSVAFILPLIGKIYEQERMLALPAGMDSHLLEYAAEGSQEAAIWMKAKLEGGRNTLKFIALLPALLTLLFGGLFLMRKRILRKNLALVK